MTFVHLCVGLVICIGIMLATGLFCAFASRLTEDGWDLGVHMAWFFSSVGFAVCLTVLLVEHGII